MDYLTKLRFKMFKTSGDVSMSIQSVYRLACTEAFILKISCLLYTVLVFDFLSSFHESLIPGVRL